MKLMKYNSDILYGTVDNKTELDPADDAAYVLWGPSWRMPTTEQQQELVEKCTWKWTTTKNGVNGLMVTGPNGNTMFLPAAGYRDGSSIYSEKTCGFYWSRTLYGTKIAYDHECNSGNTYTSPRVRSCGLCIRAVRVP